MAADLLRLERQLCFPLYSASRLITRLYQPLLEPLGLTYLQYIVMMILWEHGAMTVGEIGEKSLLDSGTLSPLLKRLEKHGLVARNRAPEDERVVQITVTAAGRALKKRCATIPADLIKRIGMPVQELAVLKTQIDALLVQLTEAQKAA